MALRSPSQLGIATSLAADDVILGISGGINFGIEFSHLVDAVGTLDAGPSLPGTAENPGVEVGSATVGLFSGGSGETEFLGLATNGAEVWRIIAGGGANVRHSYDASNYFAREVNSVGVVFHHAVGTAPDHRFLVGGVLTAGVAAGGFRVQVAGLSALARGPLDIVTAGNANSLRVDETLGTCGLGTVPVAGYQVTVLSGGRTAAILGRESTGIGVYGYVDGGSGAGLQGTNAAGSGSGVGLAAIESGVLTGSNTGPVAKVLRTCTLGAFDSTGALLQIVDTTASTGYLIQLVKQGVQKWYVDSLGNIYHHYDGSNFAAFATSSTGLLSISAIGSFPGVVINAAGSETLSVTPAGLRVETGLTSHARSLVDVVAAGNANAFRIDDTLGTCALGTAPETGKPLVVHGSASGGTPTITISDSVTGFATGVGPHLGFRAIYSTGGDAVSLAQVSGLKENSTDGNTAGTLQFFTRANGGSLTSALVITSTQRVLCQAGIGVGNSAAATTLGTVTKKIEVFDATGTSIGFAPIYDAIT